MFFDCCIYCWAEQDTFCVMGRFQNCCDAHAETNSISMYFKIWTNDILLATYSYLLWLVVIICLWLYCIYNHWPSLIFNDWFVFRVVFNAFRLDPRRRHGIVMGKQPEDLVLAWPRDLSHYPPGYPPAQPPGCCTQRCHCMDGTKRHTFPPKKWHKFDGLR